MLTPFSGRYAAAALVSSAARIGVASTRGTSVSQLGNATQTVVPAPTVLSVDAGLVVLYSLTLSQPGKKNAALNIFVVVGMLAMLMGGGKTGILGCIFGALAFFTLRGKFKSAARFILILLVIFLCKISCVSTGPPYPSPRKPLT